MPYTTFHLELSIPSGILVTLLSISEMRSGGVSGSARK